MRVSIITAVYNDIRLQHAIDSTRDQQFDGEIEHIVVDGGSSDGTVDIIDQNRDDIAILIQESDDGIYDAMNKGICASTGDVVAILNADDRYASSSSIAAAIAPFSQGARATYGDIVIERDGKVVRRWTAGTPGSWRLGWMPPHPSVFVSKDIYQQQGLFRTDMRIAADYEFMLRVFGTGRIQPVYVPQTIVRMAAGGASQSSLRAMAKGWAESWRAWQVNDSHWGPVAATLKPLRKIGQLRAKP